jgi:hypothetical protein
MPHVNELHEQHDQILVVSFASGDLAPDDRDLAIAKSLVESCPDCAALHDDIVAIAAATRALPPAVRNRDFRLTTEQAAKLRPAGWRRFVAGLSAPGSLFTRQLGLGMATLGIAGLLLSAAPSIQLGGMGSAGAAPAAPPSAPAAAEQAPEYPAGGSLELHAGPAASAAASEAPGPAAAAASPAAASGFAGFAGGDTGASSVNPDENATASGSRNTITLDHGSKGTLVPAPAPQGAGAGGAASDGSGPAVTSVPTSESGSGPSGLVIVSSLLLVAGVLVLLLRFISRRVASN